MKKQRTLVPLVVAVLFALACWTPRSMADDIHNLSLYTDDYPPYNFIENGEIIGISVDLLLEMLNAIGSNLKQSDVHLVPWARGYRDAQHESNALLFAMTRTPEREDLFQWVGPIAHSNMVLIARKSDSITINTPDNIQAYNLCAVREDIGEQLLRKLLGEEIEMELVNHGVQCAKMLERGRIDLWSYEENVAFWFIKQAGLNPEDFEIVYTIGTAAEWYGVSRQTDESIVSRLQQSLDDLGEATRSRIIQKYIKYR